MIRIRPLTAGVLWVLCSTCLPATAVEPTPWRLRDALALPGWVELAVGHRLRWENVAGQFRAGGTGGDQALVLRTSAQLTLGGQGLRASLELQDARVWQDDAGTPLDAGLVNSADLLQGYLEWAPVGALRGSVIRAGRQTIDFGTRRLIARNGYRNSPNNFTGLDFRWSGPAGQGFEAGVLAPVRRLPTARERLADNDAAFDAEDWGTALWRLAARGARDGWQLEAYLIGLNESDGVAATRNRVLYTPGFHLRRPPTQGALDVDLEIIGQWGQSRASTDPADRRDLDHRAHFESLQLGYTFRAVWTPRVLALIDHASGDHDPQDGTLERFDTLYGARRFEYGPTSLFGPFLRNNLISPGLRIIVLPHPRAHVMIGHRANWLASAKDEWTAARVRDPQGRSGRFIGHEVEVQAIWSVVPGNVVLEAGGAWLSRGEFRRRAPSAPEAGETSYLYTQITLTY